MKTGNRKTRSDKKQRAVRDCAACGARFEFKNAPSNSERKFCSRKCQNSGRKERSDKKHRTSHVCQWCGIVFSNNTNSGVDAPRQFCSNKCHGKSKKKHNSSRPRQKLSSKLMKWSCGVILRDRACIRCGATEQLQAHHVKEYSTHPELALDLDNGATLCPSCHHSQHPEHSLAFYVKKGGQTVQRCVVCEGPFVSRKKSQRACSCKCGAKLRKLQGK